MIFFIGDTHLMDDGIIRLERSPFESATEKKRIIIDNWNKIVKKDDAVYHLGDVALCDEFLLLNGDKLKFIEKKAKAECEIRDFLERTNGKSILSWEITIIYLLQMNGEILDLKKFTINPFYWILFSFYHTNHFTTHIHPHL